MDEQNGPVGYDVTGRPITAVGQVPGVRSLPTAERIAMDVATIKTAVVFLALVQAVAIVAGFVAWVLASS